MYPPESGQILKIANFMTNKRVNELKKQITAKQEELSRLRKHAAELVNTRRKFAYQSTLRDIKSTREVIAFLKKTLAQAQKKPATKILRLEPMGMKIRAGEYKDSDFEYYRLRFDMIDKMGYRVVVDVSPWHYPTGIGKYERESTIMFDASRYTEDGCYNYFPHKAPLEVIKATKAELLKWVNRESRDHYTSVVISKS